MATEIARFFKENIMYPVCTRYGPVGTQFLCF